MSFFSWPYPPPPDDPITSVGTAAARFLINGRLQHIRGFTDFASLDIFRRTGALSPLALQMQTLHHDFVSLSVPALTPRILLMKNKGSLFDLDPREIPDYFSKLDQHVSLLNQQRFIPMYVLLADCAASGMSLGYQQDFVGRACDVLRNHICLVSLVNEYNNGPQQVDPLAFDKPAGVCIARGSGTPDAPIPEPQWDWCDIHVRRDGKWLADIGNAAYTIHQERGYPGPIINSEPRKAGPGAGMYTSTTDSHALGALEAVWFRASIFHSVAGLTSAVMPDDQRNQAITHQRGIMAIPEVP